MLDYFQVLRAQIHSFGGDEGTTKREKGREKLLETTS